MADADWVAFAESYRKVKSFVMRVAAFEDRVPLEKLPATPNTRAHVTTVTDRRYQNYDKYPSYHQNYLLNHLDDFFDNRDEAPGGSSSRSPKVRRAKSSASLGQMAGNIRNTAEDLRTKAAANMSSISVTSRSRGNTYNRIPSSGQPSTASGYPYDDPRTTRLGKAALNQSTRSLGRENPGKRGSGRGRHRGDTAPPVPYGRQPSASASASSLGSYMNPGPPSTSGGGSPAPQRLDMAAQRWAPSQQRSMYASAGNVPPGPRKKGFFGKLFKPKR